MNVAAECVSDAPEWAERLQVTVSPGVSDKPSPEAYWASLWTEDHRCALDPVSRTAWAKRFHEISDKHASHPLWPVLCRGCDECSRSPSAYETWPAGWLQTSAPDFATERMKVKYVLLHWQNALLHYFRMFLPAEWLSLQFFSPGRRWQRDEQLSACWWRWLVSVWWFLSVAATGWPSEWTTLKPFYTLQEKRDISYPCILILRTQEICFDMICSFCECEQGHWLCRLVTSSVG